MKSIVVANWKMNPLTVREARALFIATKKAADSARDVRIIVAPPSLYLYELAASYRGKRVQFAAQDARAEIEGAHTGEVSLTQVKDAGAQLVLIGHAERRANGETNEDTHRKMNEALRLKLSPVLCIGEHERTDAGEHFAFVKAQLLTAFSDVAPAAFARILIAYEPVWAIGATSAMSPRDMHEMAIFIRKTIVEAYGARGHTIKILYGGAVDAENAPHMLSDGDVDGLLVGRVSTDAKAFSTLLSAIQNI